MRSIEHGIREIQKGHGSGKETWSTGPDEDGGITVNIAPATLGLRQEDLEWLIRPLLHRAWQEGATYYLHMNPYVDPPAGVDRDR